MANMDELVALKERIDATKANRIALLKRYAETIQQAVVTTFGLSTDQTKLTPLDDQWKLEIKYRKLDPIVLTFTLRPTAKQMITFQLCEHIPAGNGDVRLDADGRLYADDLQSLTTNLFNSLKRQMEADLKAEELL